MSTEKKESGLLKARAYQLEMLKASIEQNIIVAMDTGSGKTNIAILRMAHELEQSGLSKRAWFLCPTVALAEQQHKAISNQLHAFRARLLTGNDGVDTWSTQSIWDAVYLPYFSLLPSTPFHTGLALTSIADALIHGFVPLESICLLVFDEAHNCKGAAPANKIMERFYHPAKANNYQVPRVMGLSASPVITSKGGGLETIERNLDSISRTPKVHRDELLTFVQPPKLIPLLYGTTVLRPHEASMGISMMKSYLTEHPSEDPYVQHLRSTPNGANSDKVWKAVSGNTYCQEQVKKLGTMAYDVHCELGSWPAAYYLKLCITRFKAKTSVKMLDHDNLLRREHEYLSRHFDKHVSFADFSDQPLPEELSSKTHLLIETLAKEMTSSSAVIVFVKTRASVSILHHLLTTDKRTKDLIRAGTFVGTSAQQVRNDSISNLLRAKDQVGLLDKLRIGTKNLIIATSVAEEGIDISACNMVICFERPPNLKSFVQRRGRARSLSSKYFIMLADDEHGWVQDWTDLEEEMKRLYMDDLRQLEELQLLEKYEVGHREFFTPTGARLDLDEATRHLHHFCNTLPSDGFSVNQPVFILREIGHENKACQVILPSSVELSLQKFDSPSEWQTERLAKADAAFEAIVRLHEAGLINDNLMPVTTIDPDAEMAYLSMEKRPNVLDVSSQLDPWLSICCNTLPLVYTHPVILRFSTSENVEMRLLCPQVLDSIPRLTLHVSANIIVEIEFMPAIHTQELNTLDTVVSDITDLILRSRLSSKMDLFKRDVPVLCVPADSCNDPKAWLQEASGTFKASEVVDGREVRGLLRDLTRNAAPYVYHGLETTTSTVCATTSHEVGLQPMIQARKFTKKRHFHLPVNGTAEPKTLSNASLDPADCVIENLPLQFAWFAIFYPSILNHISNYYVAHQLCETILKPVAFRNTALVLTAITASSALAGYDYQRLEFFGDSLLKYRTSLTLIYQKPKWHEGILSKAKDRIVSNGTLALTCEKIGLAKFILTKAFTPKGWKMPYVNDMRNEGPTQSRELSTKILADVVEALIGAAYLDGGESSLQLCLSTLLPHVKWTPESRCFSALQRRAASMDSGILPDQYKPVETILGYTFNSKNLLLESITHASYISSAGATSYQRLEYLGDSILETIVTRMIQSHSPALSVRRSHSLRTAAVNGNFLAYLALSLTVPQEFVDIVPPGRVDRQPQRIHAVKEQALIHFLRAAPTTMLAAALRKTEDRFREQRGHIHKKLQHGIRYPWAGLAAFNAVKVVSDLVESTLAAIAIDSGGDMSACERWLERLGVLSWVRSALSSDIELLHPKEALGIAAVDNTVDYESINALGESEAADEAPTGVMYTCKVRVGGELICETQGECRMEAETKGAEMAVDILRARASILRDVDMMACSDVEKHDTDDSDDSLDQEFVDAETGL